MILSASARRDSGTSRKGAWQDVQRLSAVGSFICSASAICLERAVVRVANGRCEWKSCNDQTRYWFWFCPPPPWQPELLQEVAPRNREATPPSRDSAAADRTGRIPNVAAAARMRTQGNEELSDLRRTRNLLVERQS